MHAQAVEVEGAETEVMSSDSGEAPQNGAGQLSPLDRARAALEAEDLDKDALEEALGDVEAELSDLRAKLNSAQEEVEAVASASGSTKDQLLRLTADFENFRRRTTTEKLELSMRVKGDMITDLLPLLDNFELARTQVKAETEGEIKINNSYQGLYKQMVDIMRQLGLEAVPTVDTPFDPNMHEAIMREANDDVADGTVLMEFRKGFKMQDRLLRPAMVKVSYTDAPSEATAAETEEEEPASE